MNTTNDFIRKYESLLKEAPITTRDMLLLEKQWLELHSQMISFSRKLTKKRSGELNTFIKKSLLQAKNLSDKISSILLKGQSISIKGMISKHERLYFKGGTKGLIEKAMIENKSSTSFSELLSKVEKSDSLKKMSGETWEKEVSYFLSMETSEEDLTNLFQLESTALSLCQWYESVALTKKGGKKAHEASFTKLLNKLTLIRECIFKSLGYEFSLNDTFISKSEKKLLKSCSVLDMINTMSDNGKTFTPLLEQIKEKLSFVHPKDEYPKARKMKRKFIIHVGPTNSGKTHHALLALKEAKTGVYLAPIRLLALEIFDKLTDSNIKTDLITGDMEKITPQATHASSIIEMTRFNKEVDVAVIDEFQMIEDTKRGNAWVDAIFGLLAKEIHLCGAPHALSFITKLILECGDTYEIKEYTRQSELVLEKEDFSFPYSAQKGDALVCFSKKEVLDTVKELEKVGLSASVVYGKLPPDTRKKQVEMFSKGQTDVVVSTDAIGIGLNLPIKRIVFMSMTKFDGKQKRKLTTQEIKQIAGRAGRRGMYDRGFVNAIEDKEYMEEKLFEKEKAIVKSVVKPTDTITKLQIGTLRQRLLLWQETKTNVSYLQKADINDELFLLKQIEQWEHELSIEDIFKSLTIGFDSKDRELLLTWSSYVRSLKNNAKSLKKPVCTGSTLIHLERYYQELNLYYQFSKKFNLQMNRSWVRYEKNQVASKINQSFKRKPTLTKIS